MGDLAASRLEDMVGPVGGGERSGAAHGSMRREGVPHLEHRPCVCLACSVGLGTGPLDSIRVSACRDGLGGKEGGGS